MGNSHLKNFVCIFFWFYFFSLNLQCKGKKTQKTTSTRSAKTKNPLSTKSAELSTKKPSKSGIRTQKNLKLREQEFIKKKLILANDFTWTLEFKNANYLRYVHFFTKFKIGGVDISFSVDQEEVGCSCLVVTQYPDFKVFY